MQTRLILLLSLSLFFVCFQQTQLEWEDENYRYLNYEEMRRKINEIEKLYPRLVKVETSSAKFGIPHYVQCGNFEYEFNLFFLIKVNRCILDIITVTDFQANNNDKTQVYISGALHGDERIGPNIAYYLLEYLVSNFNQDPKITYLLKNREIIITPMTNTVGYYHFEREERINKDHPEFKNNTNHNSRSEIS